MQIPVPGDVEILAPGLRRILANNPSPMTYHGTNTFLVGEAEVAVVDPGPVDAAHLQAILAAAPGPITSILITHPHLDHSPGAVPLGAATGAPVLGYGPAALGIPDHMKALAGIGGGEGVDEVFVPDKRLQDGDILRVGDTSLQVMETPGHFAGHLAFYTDDWVLSGDHAMAWASTLISPPYGDLGDFRRTCTRLKTLAPRRVFPAHGPELDNPPARLDWLLDHRKTRDRQIQDALTDAPQSLGALTRQVYVDIDAKMLPAAERNVLAHLIDLIDRSRAKADRPLSLAAKFTRI